MEKKENEDWGNKALEKISQTAFLEQKKLDAGEYFLNLPH